MSIEVQKQIKDNSRNLSEYFADLVKWEEEEDKREKRRQAKLKGIRPDTAKKVVPPPRGSEGTEDVKDERSEDGIARDKLPMPQYYHNWDQYDPEKEVDALDQKEEDAQKAQRQQHQAEKDRILDEVSWTGDGDRVRTTKARPRVKVNIRARGRRPAPVDLAKPKKEEANNYFAQGRFKEAMVAYTSALDYLEKYEPPASGSKEKENEEEANVSSNFEEANEAAKGPSESSGAEPASASADAAGQETEALELKVTLLANRAQALIKIEEWQEAVFDCTEALRFNPQHHKAILRRGFALAKQKRWSAAARDLQMAVANDPQDRKAAAELQMANRNLAEQAKEVRAHAKTIMCDSTRQPTMPARKLNVKVCRPGSSFEAAPAAEGPESSPAASTKASPPQPRGARGDVDVLQEIEADKPVAGVAGASATIGHSGAAARQPYVPRSVRIRGRQQAQEVVATANSQSSAAVPSVAADAASMNFFTFEAQWSRLHQNPRERCVMLRRIGAEALPALFRESLDAELVGSIISVLSFELDRKSEGAVAFASAVMAALSRTNRFEASLEALSGEERAICAEVLSTLDRQPADCSEDPKGLRRAFLPAPRLPRLPDEDEEEEEDEDDVPLHADSDDAPPPTLPMQMPLAQDSGPMLPPPETVAGVAVFSLDSMDDMD